MIEKMNSFIHFVVYASMVICSTAADKCESPQYLEIGQQGNIICTFLEGFYGVAWYTEEGFYKKEPFLRFIDGEKAGDGYASGEYDVYENGSLIITNVTLQHDQKFIVIKFHSRDDVPVSMTAKVIVTVKPVIAAPVIEICQQQNLPCFTHLRNGSTITCYIANSRPAVPLNWFVRTSKGDVNISLVTSITNDSALYTVQATTNGTFSHTSFLRFVVCKAQGIPGMLEQEETAVLIENRDIDLSVLSPVRKYVEKGSPVRLMCSNENISLIVWKKVGYGKKVFSVLCYAAFIEDGFLNTYSDEYTLEVNGSLYVREVDIHQEGLYGCVFENEYTAGSALFDLIVTVPASPVVHGCIPEEYCLLVVERKGSLTCSVAGIRPIITLKWTTLYERQATFISFTDEKLTIKSNGKGVYDIRLTSSYEIHGFSINRITLQCIITGIERGIFKSTTKFDLLLPSDQATEKPVAPNVFPLAWILISFTPLCLLIIPLYRCCIRPGGQQIGERRRTRRIQRPREEEVQHMMSGVAAPEKVEPELKSVFIKQIKTKYKDQYDAVQPIPYIKDKLYCVQRVFVECGIERLSNEGGKKGLENWKKLNSYHEVLEGTEDSSTRTILEGDPGYGKSTLTLQLAYDWCNGTDGSSLANKSILILLRLRQLRGIKSVFRAIRQFILPKDSPVTEEDIENILRESNSTVFILDGFDEYPDGETEDSNDILSIIRRDMFQEDHVILTTRISLLPKSFPPDTNRIRLTGFDETARDSYINKAVVEQNVNAAKKIKRSLKKNLILQALCQVPLFFVMFAHMTYEGGRFLKFKTVTSFFHHMIACFHSHMRNKMKDQNVERFDLPENNHEALDHVAFDGLSGKTKNILWKKSTLLQRLGCDLYNHYKRIGILVEEEILDFTDTDESMCYKTEVRFYHKLFCEWYAAHYLTRKVKEPEVDVDDILKHMNPFDLQYMYRFACGLDQNIGEKIIKHLREVKGGDKFALLCMFEQSGKFDHIKETVREMCLNYVTIDNNDSILQQGSVVQLLEMGSANQVPISFVWLKDCFKSANVSSGTILLKAKLSLQALPTMTEVAIAERGRTMTNDEISDVFAYASKCSALKSVRFCNTVMPQSVHGNSVSDLQSRKIQVLWITDDAEYYLNLRSGKWEVWDSSSSVDPFSGNMPAKRNLFVVLMKKKYDELYSSVQRDPNDHNRLYIVDQIFVDGGIDRMVFSSKGSEKVSWEAIESYEAMFTDKRCKSKRRIIQGQLGFGKSTLTLQMACDWCNGNRNSPLSNTEFFLLIRLTDVNITMSVYNQLKNCVLPIDSPLGSNDIRKLISVCSSTLMVFDSFNLYADQTISDNCDIMGIIQGKILKDIDVIITSNRVLKDYMEGTKLLRLSGFTDRRQEEYIRKSAVGTDIAAVNQIRHLLQANSDLKDLCRIPLFFATFARMFQENDRFKTFITTRTLATLFMECMYSHVGKQIKDIATEEFVLFSKNHIKLGEVAFEGLCEYGGQIVWKKEALCQEIGRKAYKQQILIGILVEEDVIDTSSNGNTQTRVTFIHKIICEWHASHYIAKHALKWGLNKWRKVVENIKKSQCEYLCRLTYEIKHDVEESIGCLMGRQHCDEFAIIWILECNAPSESILGIVTDLCSRQITFSQEQNELQQISRVTLLEFASRSKIPITWVCLSNTFGAMESTTENNIKMKSNICIPVLNTLKVLTIEEEARQITTEDLLAVLKYAAMCIGLEKLVFGHCLLPQFINVDSVPGLRSRNIIVMWIAPISADYLLNFGSGIWEREPRYGGGAMTDNDYEQEVKYVRSLTE